MANPLCKILGIVLLLVGIVGFLRPDLLGMHLSVTHNIIHLMTAVLALYFGFAASVIAARTFCLALGAIYLFLGILGFVAPGTVAAILQTHLVIAGAVDSLTPDNLVHLLLGAVFLVAGLLRSPVTAPEEPSTTPAHPEGK
jgi:hypothetical protein